MSSQLTLQSSYSEKLDKEAINHLPVARWDGPIELIRDDADLPAAIERLSQERVLGFDTETRPSFRKGTAYDPTLMQLGGEKVVYLFQLGMLEQKALLTELLTREDLLKVGVGLGQDVRQLQPLFKFEPGGFVDVSETARHNQIANRGLRSLAAAFYGIRISKRAQCSNWAVDTLQSYQVTYAATDAWISRELFIAMEEMALVDLQRDRVDLTPPKPKTRRYAHHRRAKKVSNA
uniref:Putative 3'-5' exonuclease n=1 Tax=Magnetococcus massalia (strain MO-1) TaxID=451514 RepID=A0A1S7LDA4_MAGMO|nr:putative 3'-5' exonuclease [Candidatus Magnetococcus massalia]